MKKAILIIISVIVIIFSFVACENNSSSEITATTAVTNEQGTTHYYKAITDKIHQKAKQLFHLNRTLSKQILQCVKAIFPQKLQQTEMP